MSRLLDLTRRFAKDCAAVASIEFAMIAPMMLIVFFGTVEATNLMTAKRRVTNSAATAADITAQATEIFDGDVTEIFNAVSSVMAPFDATNTEIIITSVRSDIATGAVTVHWSEAVNASAYAPGAAFNLPAGLIQLGSSVIVGEVRYTHRSPLSQYVLGDLDLEDTFYMRPRRANVVRRCTTPDNCI